MKIREYISPSGIKTFYDSNNGVEQFYLRYLCDTKLENEPQTKPMAIGSAFDAYIKSHLHERLFGKGHDPAFELDTILETQVEPQHRQWGKVHGKYVFDNYVKCGAVNDLWLELSQASETPRFEFSIQGGVKCKTMDTEGLVLLGKPDCYYKNKAGHPVVLDFKVNGYEGKGTKSPAAGYVKLRHCDGTEPKYVSHKDAVLATKHGIVVNTAKCLEDVDKDWAAQLAIYGWLLGMEVGEEFLTCIDQLVFKWTGGFPEMRVAEHRTWVSADFQLDVLKKAKECWDIIHSDHIFRDMSYDESKQRCLTLDNYSSAEGGREGTAEDLMFKELTRTKTW